ncbi:MAG: RDD family protein [Acidimicrobiia bacterium]
MTRPALATVGDRFIAKVIDGVVLAVAMLIVHFVFLRGASRVAHLAVGVPIELLYSVLPVALYGQTLGKAARRIRVVGRNGGSPGWSRAARRSVVAALPLYVPVPLLEPLLTALVYLRVFTAPDRRGLHDLIADTMVVSDLAPTREVTTVKVHRRR